MYFILDEVSRVYVGTSCPELYKGEIMMPICLIQSETSRAYVAHQVQNCTTLFRMKRLVLMSLRWMEYSSDQMRDSGYCNVVCLIIIGTRHKI